MTKPENFLKSSSELNLVLRSITRSQVLRWAGPAWITASISLHTEVFIRPNEVMTSSWNVTVFGIKLYWEYYCHKMMTPFTIWFITRENFSYLPNYDWLWLIKVSSSIIFSKQAHHFKGQSYIPWDHPLRVCGGLGRAHGGECSALQPCWSKLGWRYPGTEAAAPQQSRGG